MQTVFSAFRIMLRKTASLCVSWKTEGNPPREIQGLLPEDLHRGTSAFRHWADYETYRKGALLPDTTGTGNTDTINHTLTVQSLKDCLALSCPDKEKERIIRESFYFLHTDDFSMKLLNMCEDHIAVYTDEGFVLLNKDGRICRNPVPSHPMMKCVVALSKMTLKAFNCSSLEEVTEKCVIYVALLYMNDTPAYYVGKAKGGIKDRWCKQAGSHCKKVNDIIHCFEYSAGRFELLVGHQQCDLAIAGAVLKQVATEGTDGVATEGTDEEATEGTDEEATEGTDGVALFAIDFCPDGQTKCCTSHKRDVLDHHEQHYMNAFKDLFPDSDTEPKMKCLNVKESCLCHYCSDGVIRGCSTEVALSLFLHDLQLV